MALRPGSLVAALIGWMMGREAPAARARAEEIRAAEPGLGFWGRVGKGIASQYLHTDARGQRHVGWRAWLLLWLLPAGFAIGAAVAFIDVAWRQQAGMLLEAEVVQVYQWEGTGPFDRGALQYSPVFRFTDTQGRVQRLTPGLRHADWDFPVGSRHMVRHVPGSGQVTIPGHVEYTVSAVVGLIALLCGLIALPLHLRLRRWLRGAA